MGSTGAYQWVQPGTTPHGIETCMMVAVCLGQGVRHQPMGAWIPRVDITVCTITAGSLRHDQRNGLSPWPVLG